MAQILQNEVDFDIKNFNLPILIALSPGPEISLLLAEIIVMYKSSIVQPRLIRKTNHVDFTDINYSFVLALIIFVNKIF